MQSNTRTKIAALVVSVSAVGGKLSTGYLIRCCGDYYEVFSNEITGKFLKRIRYGFKIGNAIKGDVVYFRKAMPVGIGLSYKRNKE